MNGFELAGRPMKVGHVTERTDQPVGPSGLDSEELDKAGIDLGATGRLALMAKLAEGTGMKLPQAANQALSTAAANAAIPSNPQNALDQHRASQQQQQQQLSNTTPPIATQAFLLSNMFNPEQETNPDWDVEVRDDVIEECNKYGGVLHIFVDKSNSAGHVYVKCPNVQTAVAAVNALHGRWFAGGSDGKAASFVSSLKNVIIFRQHYNRGLRSPGQLPQPLSRRDRRQHRPADVQQVKKTTEARCPEHGKKTY